MSLRSAPLKALLTLVGLLSSRVASESGSALSVSEIEDIFYLYDVPENDAPDCQPQSVDNIICPKDEQLPCGPIENIVEYCENILGGADIVKKFEDVKEIEAGKNALAGCVKYIGYHVFDLDHMACCESDFCEDWIGEQFEKFAMSEEAENAQTGGQEDGMFYDDDDDDDDMDDDMDDDGFEQEF